MSSPGWVRARNGERTWPGTTALTRRLARVSHSSASVDARDASAAFDAAYAPQKARGSNPRVSSVKMMLASGAIERRGSARRVSDSAAVTLTSKAVRHASGSWCSIGPSEPRNTALCTIPSSRPSCERSAPATSSKSERVAFARSSGRMVGSGFPAATISSYSASSLRTTRPCRITVAPRAAQACASGRPRPPVAPVTRIARPARSTVDDCGRVGQRHNTS